MSLGPLQCPTIAVNKANGHTAVQHKAVSLHQECHMMGMGSMLTSSSAGQTSCQLWAEAIAGRSLAGAIAAQVCNNTNPC